MGNNILQSFSESWFYYIVPALFIFISFIKRGKEKKNFIKIGLELFCLVACFRAFERKVEIVDMLVLGVLPMWTFYTLFKKDYNDGFNDGYACAKEDIENEYRRKNAEGSD